MLLKRSRCLLRLDLDHNHIREKMMTTRSRVPKRMRLLLIAAVITAVLIPAVALTNEPPDQETIEETPFQAPTDTVCSRLVAALQNSSRSGNSVAEEFGLPQPVAVPDEVNIDQFSCAAADADEGSGFLLGVFVADRSSDSYWLLESTAAPGLSDSEWATYMRNNANVTDAQATSFGFEAGAGVGRSGSSDLWGKVTEYWTTHGR